MQSPQTTSGTHRSGADSEDAAPAPGHDHWDPPKPCETPTQRGTGWYPKAVGSGKASRFPAGFLVPPGKVLGTGLDPVLASAPSQPSLPTWGEVRGETPQGSGNTHGDRDHSGLIIEDKNCPKPAQHLPSNLTPQGASQFQRPGLTNALRNCINQ